MTDVRDGKATISDMANYYSVSIEDIAEHYSSHDINTITDLVTTKINAIIDTPDTALTKLGTMINYMEEIVDHYAEDPDMRYERSTVDMIIKIFKQMESTIMKSAELQGFIKQPTQTTNIAVIETSVSERITGILTIIQDAPICDECKIKLLDDLEERGYL